MTHEPWKRAAQLSRLRQGRTRGSTGPSGTKPPGRRVNWLALVLVVFILLAAIAATLIWLSRGWWVPRYRDSLPVMIGEQVSEPRVYPDFIALEQGMDAGLVMFGNYLDLIADTREWRSDWKIIQTGPSNLRMENSGIRVYVENGEIENFVIDLEELMADEQWQGWHPAWTAAQLTPDLTWTACSGEREMPGGLTEMTHVRSEPVARGANFVRPAWVLQFHDGWLRRIESRIEFGASTDGG